MKKRTLRRKIIIREYDFERVRDQAFRPLGICTLYDRAEFVPLNKDALEHENLIKLLKNGENKNLFKPTSVPAIFLFNIKDHLYDQKYIEWHSEYDDEGYIWVQARKNTPRTRLGWGVFEKDLESRL
jgi:hypothetical protein